VVRHIEDQLRKTLWLCEFIDELSPFTLAVTGGVSRNDFLRKRLLQLCRSREDSSVQRLEFRRLKNRLKNLTRRVRILPGFRHIGVAKPDRTKKTAARTENNAELRKIEATVDCSSGASPGEMLTDEGWEDRMRGILKKKVEAFDFDQYSRLRVGFHDLVSALQGHGNFSPKCDSPEAIETDKRSGEAEDCSTSRNKAMKRHKSQIADSGKKRSSHDGKGTIRFFFPDIPPGGDFSTVVPGQQAKRLTPFYLLPASSVEKSMFLDRAKNENHPASRRGDSEDVTSNVSRSHPPVLYSPLSTIEGSEEPEIASSRIEGNQFAGKGAVSSELPSHSDGDDRKAENMLHSDRKQDKRRAAFTHQQENRQGSYASSASVQQGLLGGDAEKREGSFSSEPEHTMKTFRQWNLLTTPKRLCNDNGVMIAWAAVYTLRAMERAAVCEHQFDDVSSFASHHALSSYRPCAEKNDKDLFLCHSEVRTGREHYVTTQSSPSCTTIEKTRTTAAPSRICAGKEDMMEMEGEAGARREGQTNEGQGCGEPPTGDEVRGKDNRKISGRFNLDSSQNGENFLLEGVDSAIQKDKGGMELLRGQQERYLERREEDLMVRGGQDENRVYCREKNEAKEDRCDLQNVAKNDTGKGADGEVFMGHNGLPILHLEKRKDSEELKVQGSDTAPIRAPNSTDTVEENFSLCSPTIRGKERKDDKALVIPKWLGGDSLCDDNILGKVELLILECILNQ
ncbi:glycoprotease family protein, partial [Cystoisospora suis]